MFKLVTILIFLYPAIGIAGDNYIVNFNEISDKTFEEVTVALGEPDICVKKFVEDIKSCSFGNKKIEIYFVSGRSDWIIIKIEGNHRRVIDAVKLIGLEVSEKAKLSLDTGISIFYEPYLNFRSLNLGGKPDSLKYISIKVKTLNYGKYTPTGEVYPWNKEVRQRIEKFTEERKKGIELLKKKIK